MKDKTLLKIALATSIIGLFLLFLISDSIEVDQTALDRITLNNVDETVKIQGTITSVRDLETVTITTIQQPEERTAILFKGDSQPTALQEGMHVEILGKVDEYNGNPEIIAHRIRILP